MKNIWIIGAGPIAQEYAKVLMALGYRFTVIGRGEQSAVDFKLKTGVDVIRGGVNNYLGQNPDVPSHVFVVTKNSESSPICKELMQYGVKSIFCEKPGFLYPSECEDVKKITQETGSKLYYAYNRRFFASVLKAKEIIAEDGGVTSFNFEFTEWSHVIEKLPYPKEFLENHFYGNSTHVVDLAFHLGGNPIRMNCETSGELSWHKPAIFVGSGVTDKGALFSYQANWTAPGRWSVEMLTPKHRLIFRPMEQLQIQNIGSVAINSVEIDDSLDKEFKPGFYLETKAFLDGDYFDLCSIEEQYNHVVNIYNKMMGK